MLDLERFDLGELCVALEDHSYETQWWLDPRTGELEPHFESSLEENELGDPEERGLVPVEPVPSSESYRDLAEFTERVRDPRARDLLERAIAGRGAFRRFKDTLVEFPSLREAWFEFHDARMERRAIEWLADEGVVDEGVAARAIAERGGSESPELGGAFDPWAIAREAAADLRRLYGDRLREVFLYGSWARADAHPESDIDLLVVLDRVDSLREEHRRMDDILWRHSLANDTVIAEIPVSEADFREGRSPFLARARAEGAPVG